MKKKIAGASFSLYPMSDDFVSIILDSIEQTDTSKVWLKTDDVTTTVRGKIVHVFDVVQAIFIHAMKTGEHVALQATYSMGCPGDAEGQAKLSCDDIPANAKEVASYNEYAAAKFSLYPLGKDSYMEQIYEQIEAMKEYVTVTPAHYSTHLAGGISDIFKGLEAAFRAVIDGGSEHTVMTVSISANSPSHQEKN